MMMRQIQLENAVRDGYFTRRRYISRSEALNIIRILGFVSGRDDRRGHRDDLFDYVGQREGHAAFDAGYEIGREVRRRLLRLPPVETPKSIFRRRPPRRRRALRRRSAAAARNV